MTPGFTTRGLLPSFSAFLLALAPATPLRAYDEVIDSPMYKAPAPPAPKVIWVIPDKAMSLWLKALEQPEADLKCKAADSIARAHREGMPGLEATVSPLLAAMDQPDQHPTARLAIARTLIALDARESSRSLFNHGKAATADLRDLVEPALARWQYPPARAMWLERLHDPDARSQGLVLAIRGLAASGEKEAAAPLRELALSEHTSGPIRLEAARALGRLLSVGMEKDAERLAAGVSPMDIPSRLVAASLLVRHSSEEAVRLLQHLADDAEPTVVVIAAARLLEIDPALLVPSVERLIASPDANVRLLAVETLFRNPTEKHVRLLADRLDDVHPDVRRKARWLLKDLAAQKNWADEVIAQTSRILATNQWRGQEQATILLTELDHKPAGQRLVELLGSKRPEVAVTAAWGLRKLAVSGTLPGVLSFVEAAQKRPSSGVPHRDPKEISAESIDHQLSQLNQFFGQQKYEPADKALRPFVPRRPDNSWPESRAAAIWALGMIHEGKTVAPLATAVEERLKDINSIPPEFPQVRFTSAIMLARIHAKDALPSLREFCRELEPNEDPVNNACCWAIGQLTGESMPAPKTIRKIRRDKFLTSQD
jgi:HEAT repeat protein